MPAGQAGPVLPRNARDTLRRVASIQTPSHRVLSQRIRVFHEVASQLNYSKAAQALGISQPAVLFHIRGLEEDLGVGLFERVGKQLFLTAAGRVLQEDATRMVLLEEEARIALTELAGLDRGVLVVGASATIGIYLVPEVLGAFRERHPSLHVNLKLGNKVRTMERLRGNEVDFGLVAGPLREPDLVSEPYLEDELIPIISPSHRLAGRHQIQPGELRTEMFLMQSAAREPNNDSKSGCFRWVFSRQKSCSLGSPRRSSSRWPPIWASRRPRGMPCARNWRPDGWSSPIFQVWSSDGSCCSCIIKTSGCRAQP